MCVLMNAHIVLMYALVGTHAHVYNVPVGMF